MILEWNWLPLKITKIRPPTEKYPIKFVFTAEFPIPSCLAASEVFQYEIQTCGPPQIEIRDPQ